MLPVQRFIINARENEERIYENRVQKRVMRDQSDVFSLHDRRFIELFRLNKDLVAYLFNNVANHLNEEIRSTRIPRETRILIALGFFATGNYQRGIAEEFLSSTSQQVVSRCIHEVAEAIINNLGHLWIRFPRTPREINDTKRGFMEKAGFPGIVGCIDCTHIAIIAPSEEEHNYVNRKGFHSKNIQIICTSDLQIININARYCGSTNDAFIWRASSVRNLLEFEYNRGERTSWLLGDSGYPLEPWLLTPIENAQPATPEGRYNQSHKITRSIVERCIGRFKLVFRCILGERKLRYNPLTVGTIVNACAILHNLCIRVGVEYDLNFDNALPELNYNNDDVHQHNPILAAARQVRQQLVDRYF